jgi:hypothetical protein
MVGDLCGYVTSPPWSGVSILSPSILFSSEGYLALHVPRRLKIFLLPICRWLRRSVNETWWVPKAPVQQHTYGL